MPPRKVVQLQFTIRVLTPFSAGDVQKTRDSFRVSGSDQVHLREGDSRRAHGEQPGGCGRAIRLSSMRVEEGSFECEDLIAARRAQGFQAWPSTNLSMSTGFTAPVLPLQVQLRTAAGNVKVVFSGAAARTFSRRTCLRDAEHESCSLPNSFCCLRESLLQHPL